MQNYDAKLKSADDYFAQEKYLHAIQIYKELLEDRNYHRIASVKLAEIYEKMGNIDAVIKMFDNLMDENPLDTDLQRYYALFLIRNSKYEKALDVLLNIPEINFEEKSFLIGISYYRLNEYEIAKINLEDFVEANKKSELIPEAYQTLSKIYYHFEDLDKALELVKKAEYFQPNALDLYSHKAQIYYDKGMWYHAFEAIRRGLSFDEENVALNLWAGKILYEMEEFVKAESHLKFYAENGKPDSEVYSLLGIICKLNNKINEARSYFELALKLNPENKLARKEIG